MKNAGNTKNRSVEELESARSKMKKLETKLKKYEQAQQGVNVRKRAEEGIKHLNAVLTAIRNVNQIIVREKDPGKLIKRACEVLTKTRGYFTAWIALLGDSGTFSQIASSGFNTTFKPLEDCIQSGRLGKCSLALRKRGALIVHDPAAECGDCPAARTYKNQSAIAIRLHHGGKRVGLMVLSMDARMVDDAGEQHLIAEVADDIAYSLQNLETEKKRIEAEKSEIETLARYRTLFEQSQDAILVSTPEGTIEDANAAGAAIFGLTPQTVRSHRAADLYVNPADRQAVVQGLKLRGSIRNHAITYRRADGSIFDALINTQTILAPEGTGVEYLTTVRDITEVKRAQDELRASEERYRTTMMSVGDGVIATDTKGCVELLNPVAEALTGWRQEEARGKPLEDIFCIINEETRQIVENPVCRVMREGTVVGLANHTVLIARDDTEHPIADSGAPLRNEKGEISGVVLVFRDQTVERTVQKALHESERKFRETVTHLDEGFYSCMMDGVLLEHNQAFNRILGFEIERDLKGEKLPDFWQNPDERKVYLQELMTGGSITNYLINAKTTSGEKVVVMANSHLVKDEKGGLVRIEGTFSDFTERKRVEEALQESEEGFRIAAETSNDVVYEWDLKQSVKWFGKIDEMLGYDPGEFPRTLDGLGASVHPEDWVRVMAAVQAHLEGRSPYAEEYRAIKKDGSFRWWSARGAVARTPDGKPIRWIGTVTDITERKRAEEALHEANENLERRVLERTLELTRSKQLLDETGRLARVGGWEINLEKNELVWNDVVRQIHEVDPEYHPTVEGGINFYAPEAVPIISECVERAVVDGLPFDVELQLITAKQNRIWVRAIGQAYKANGKIVKVGGVFQDIQQRKLAEIEVRKKSEQLQLLSNELEIIIDSIPGLVFFKDTNNRLIRVNKYMSDAYKMSKKALEGISLNDLHTKEQAQAYYEADLQVIRSRQPKINIDEPWETETGTRWVSTSKIPYLNETGEVVGVIGVSMDVTERKLAEIEREALMQQVAHRSALLEAANTELEAFTYSVSHDLRAPLRHTSGYVELLAKRCQADLPENGRHYLISIADSVRQMGKLIDDLLQFSRTGRMEMRQQDVDMNAIVHDIIASMRNDSPERTIEWVQGELPAVVGDDAMLRLVWTNLLGNAVKFTRTRKKARIEIGVREENKELVFFVRDDGVGFDMQYAQKLFGVFQRLHPTEEFEGTGIGLANVRRIILRHGGRTWAEASLDKGATFYFSIPKP
jgi:PAS domain S-box-containing protein